ncbi:MAG: hypothetical protein H3C34_07265 [Caldilineaceae bacterium]|nr:hypothetical protein [Caldilineaceae bacterium]
MLPQDMETPRGFLVPACQVRYDIHRRAGMVPAAWRGDQMPQTPASSRRAGGSAAQARQKRL